MLSSLFDTRPRRHRHRTDQSPFASSYARTATPPRNSRQHYNQRRIYHYDHENESENASSEDENNAQRRPSAGEETEDDENNEEAAPLLPIFDSSHLDTLPIYTLTHTIRLMVVTRCETVLTWDQLRSPQVSQFLIKPMQQEIQTSHFSAATIYCLMANCLQFAKEMDLYPGNSGTSQTRAVICELLAIKLLKEYSTRGLIDALSYDFDPLQGQAELPLPLADSYRRSWQPTSRRNQTRSARISCLEIAIRAQAKRFLAHPLVVQQLGAIWDGSIVFHAAADSAHRKRGQSQQVNYGTTSAAASQHVVTEGKTSTYIGSRKVVTLYNPHDASLFKLSRLRVPRYRNILSTLSFAILLALFVAVLIQRSLHITALEVVFWIWAGGYMMDEVVGFTEQGFGLYIASFWNTIDLGIVLILFAHFCLRVYGIVMPDVRKRSVANTAFDLLAADAILLFPRLFSVLDHYRYFSQLIIAFRLMAADLAAVFVLIVIACSGFFVALTLSFGYENTDNASDVAYALFQMVMGFTPAVWDRWDHYTILGRAIMVLFITLCHFLVLTILITVLTNSFMAVVKNANEEHQFIFAINTISSVKSDTLFSYVPPLNVLQWMLSPLRYTLPFKQYVRLNRTVIKITHFPILFPIYVYEKTILQPAVVDSIDVVENRHRTRSLLPRRLPRLGREPSIANFRQDQALEEVFKQPFDATMRTTNLTGKKQSSTVVNKWMHDMGEELVSPPQEDDPKTVDRLERKRLGERSLSAFSRARKVSGRALSVASDPGDLAPHLDFFSPQTHVVSGLGTTPSHVELDVQEDTAEADDEMLTNDDNDDRMTIDTRGADAVRPLPSLDYISQRPSPISRTPLQGGSIGSGSRGLYADSSGHGSPARMTMRIRPQNHMRNISSATMIFNPPADETNDELQRPPTAIPSRPITPGSKPASSGTGKKTPKLKQISRLRPAFPSKDDPAFRSAPDLKSMLRPAPPQNPRRSSLEMDLVSDIGDNKAIGGGYVGAIPASFATQLAYASGGLKQIQQQRKEEQEMFSRLMMARMNSLEEGFRDVIHEMRENMKTGSKGRSPERPVQVRRERRAATREAKGKEKDKAGSSGMEVDDSGGSAFLDSKFSGLSVVTVVPGRQPATEESEGEMGGKDEQ